VVVGLNRFTVDAGAVEAALAALRRAAEGTENVLYPMKEALRARATVGEVCHALRSQWGLYRPVDQF
jgi:methylmalonyl-CoA mutase N-terminal domain/subunit